MISSLFWFLISCNLTINYESLKNIYEKEYSNEKDKQRAIYNKFNNMQNIIRKEDWPFYQLILNKKIYELELIKEEKEEKKINEEISRLKESSEKDLIYFYKEIYANNIFNYENKCFFNDFFRFCSANCDKIFYSIESLKEANYIDYWSNTVIIENLNDKIIFHLSDGVDKRDYKEYFTKYIIKYETKKYKINDLEFLKNRIYLLKK